jgi:hypothetical protein
LKLAIDVPPIVAARVGNLGGGRSIASRINYHEAGVFACVSVGQPDEL